ncbi:hypothetical protein [Streptomyces badius]|uniref:Uncharacterized protein n=1 Tax=Streptomyces badius TaxID=1941 RepID=A0ABQ2TG90_STRBA|nr:hypothetical protein [Streptomyces badius]GGS65742.1 hypothetical protein GCM10010253_45800 [Streptomyces badius]
MRIPVLGGTRSIGRAMVERLAADHEATVLNRGTRPPAGPGVATLVADRTGPRQIAAVLTRLTAAGVPAGLPLVEGLRTTLGRFRSHDGLGFAPTPLEERWKRTPPS